MAIDPSIAMGVRPIEQPNMLAQAGQVMQLRQMQQENESNNALRDFYASGGDPSTPEGRRELMSRNPKAGVGILKELAAERSSTASADKARQDMGSKVLDIMGAAYGGLANNPTLEYAKPMFEHLVSSGAVPPQVASQLFAKLSADPSQIKALAQQGVDAAISAKERMTDATTQRGQNMTASTAARGQNMVAGTAAIRLDFDRQKQDLVASDNGYILKDPYGNVKQVQGYGTLNGPNAPAKPLPPAAAGNFVSGNALNQTPSVNALTAQPSAPIVDNAGGMQNVPKPKEPIRQPVAVMKDGKAVLVKPEEAVGMQPASADAEKAARLQAQKVKDLSLTIKNLEDVTKPGGLISQSTGSGVGRAYDIGAGVFGQATEGAIATAKLAPIADLVLKMVPRFEGPQSDKDTQSYKEAAGQLANSNLPTKIRQEAGKEILRLMKEYKGQFVTDDMAKEGFGGAALSGQDQQAMDWANANPKDPRAAQIKQRLGG